MGLEELLHSQSIYRRTLVLLAPQGLPEFARLLTSTEKYRLQFEYAQPVKVSDEEQDQRQLTYPILYS